MWSTIRNEVINSKVWIKGATREKDPETRRRDIWVIVTKLAF